jgi:hypothetical protein
MHKFKFYTTGSKPTLLKSGGDTLNEVIKLKIRNFIVENYNDGEYTKQSEIIKHIQKGGRISDTAVRNSISELIKDRKISTFYDGNRYYGPTKIALPLKVCTGMITSILFGYLLIELLLPSKILSSIIYLYSDPNSLEQMPKVNMVPFVGVSIFITLIITIFWYLDSRKSYKE